MTQQEMSDLLLRCNGAELDAIAAKLKLSNAISPAANQSPAACASLMLDLAIQRDLLQDLESILLTAAPTKSKVILILSANPVETDPSQIDPEVRFIKESTGGYAYSVESVRAMNATDIATFLLQYQPAVVHFSGHGTPTGDIVLGGQNGEPVQISASDLGGLFETLTTPVECVVLNACYCQDHALALAKHVGCVIGMDKTMGDSSALQFASSFYRGLGLGNDYEAAFRLGCGAMDLASLPDAALPHCTTRDRDLVAQISAEAGPTEISIESLVRSGSVIKGVGIVGLQVDTPRLFPVWFGTNRKPLDTTDLSKGFSADRDTAVHFGTCQVAIPKSHKFGSVGSAWWKRLVTLTDDRVLLKNVSTLQEAVFWDSARKALAEWDAGERMALVFIHGFNVTFKDAAIRAAQMAFDLKVPGVSAFFSWPSKGRLSLFDYTADEASVEASEAQISDFLTNFAQKTDAGRVDVIAHSMGNRGLLRAMQRIVHSAAAAAKKPFRHIIFTAPDVDSDVFRDLAKAHDQLADYTTLYLSSKDRALKSSGLLYDAPRAGFVPPVTLVKGIDVIEVSNADLTLLGHGYYGAAEGVLYDMRELLMHDTAPGSRARLAPADAPGDSGAYWTIGA